MHTVSGMERRMERKQKRRRVASDAVEVLRLQNELEYWKLHFAHERFLVERKEKERKDAAKEPAKEAGKGSGAWKPAEGAAEVEADIVTLEDLLAFIGKLEDSKEYLFDKRRLKRIEGPLKRLNEYVGQEGIKRDVAQQVLYFLQRGELCTMNHTVITGPSGVGKTTIAGILAEIYHGLELVRYTRPPPSPTKVRLNELLGLDTKPPPVMNELTGKPSAFPVVLGNRANMVAMYVGQTVKKTQEVINRALGGVLVIDEAYELGQNDCYSQECIDTLNRNLSEHSDKFVCIMLGYEKEMESNIFGKNAGMRRRFPYRYTMETYGPEQLQAIFVKKLKEQRVGCAVPAAELQAFFEGKAFSHFGGDMETLAAYCVKSNARRLFGKLAFRPAIEMRDLEDGYQTFLKNKTQDAAPANFAHMYA